MTITTPKATTAWRWVLIIAQLLVVGSLVTAALLPEPQPRQPAGLFAAIGIAAFLAWMFLFLGSPFLVRSQGWLAILGWGLAIATFVTASFLFRSP